MAQQTCQPLIPLSNTKDVSETENEFLKFIQKNVQLTIKKYNLFSKNDRVFVAFSGGKDSTVLLDILVALGYKVEAITVNAYIGCYSKENLAIAEQFCTNINVPLHHISFREHIGYSLCHFRTLLQEKGVDLKACSICGVFRRYLLNRETRKLQGNIIAFGHNLDDEAQTILMNLFKGNVSLSARLGPKTGVNSHSKFVARVKPLYFILEEDIVRYSKIKGFNVHYGDCPCSVDSFRYSVKKVVKNLSRDQKNNIIYSFVNILPGLKKEYATIESVGECTSCHEPSQQPHCKACEMMNAIK